MKKLREKMRNIGKYSLTIFLCALYFIPNINVKAIDSGFYLKAGDTIATASYSKANVNEAVSTWSGANNTTIAMWNINGAVGFCASPGVHALSNKFTVRLVGTKTVSGNQAKALNYWSTHGGGSVSYIQAQLFLWGSLSGSTRGETKDDIATALCARTEDLAAKKKAACDRWHLKCMGTKNVTKSFCVDDYKICHFPEGTCNTNSKFAIQALENASSTPVTVYVWEAACGGGQKIYTLRNSGTPFNPDTNKEIQCVETDCDPEVEECDDIPDDKCTYDEMATSVVVPGRCASLIEYYDSFDWECISYDKNGQIKEQFKDSSITCGFESQVQGDGAGVTITVNDTDNFCKFFCRESVVGTLPGGNVTFRSGRFYKIGNAGVDSYGPIVFSGFRECRSYYQKGAENTPGVDVDNFEVSLNRAEVAVKNAFTDYHREMALQDSFDTTTVYNPGQPGYDESKCYEMVTDYDKSANKSGGGQACTEDEYFVRRVGSGDSCQCIYNYGSGEIPYGCGNIPATCPDGYPREEGGKCYGEKKKFYSYRTKGDSFSYTKFDNGTAYANYPFTCSKGGVSLNNPYDVGAKKTSYDNAMIAQKRILKSFDACDNAHTKYTFEPEITVVDNALDYLCEGTTNVALVPSSTAEGQAGITPTVTSNTGGSEWVYLSTCADVNNKDSGGGNCTEGRLWTKHVSKGNIKLITNDERVITYSFENYYYDKTSKVNGLSYKTGTSGSQLVGEGGLYTTLPDNVIPISFVTPSGKYDIPLTYRGVGNKYASCNASGRAGYHDEQIPNHANLSGAVEAYGNYVCDVYVENDIIRDGGTECYGDRGCLDKLERIPTCIPPTTQGGLNVIYRTIQLEIDNYISGVTGSRGTTQVNGKDYTIYGVDSDYFTTFPSYNGNGRSPGGNWLPYEYDATLNISISKGCDKSTGASCAGGKTIDPVTEYVNNNRNVSGYNVYSLKPLYTVYLTPTRIYQIRQYNKVSEDEYGPYKGSGYADMQRSMKCYSTNIAGRNCLSSFIHSTFNAFFTEGTCLNVTPSDAKGTKFDECRYNN